MDMMKRGCQFCDFVDGDVIICQDHLLFAVISKRPINAYHVLVIPREHFEFFADLPDNIAAHVFITAKRLSTVIRRVCHPDVISHLSDDDISWGGFNLVEHYKFHLIPRFKNDEVKIDWHRGQDPGSQVRSKYAGELRELLGNRD
jgi:histidine triad (HIT) family protein